MKKNIGLKALTVIIVSVVVIILVNTSQKRTTSVQDKSDPNNLNEAIASQFNDNIRDVSARLMETEKKMRAIEKQNQALSAQNAELSVMKKKVVAPIQQLPPDVNAKLEFLKKELMALKSGHESRDSQAIFPIGQLASNDNKQLVYAEVKDIDGLLMKHQLSEQEREYWNALNAKHQRVKKPLKKKVLKHRHKKIHNEPYYTIPAGSDLGHTTLMSALIGEVPNDGKLMQPLFPFTAIISRGDLMASNGVPLPPDISGMKVNGYAIGVGSFLDNISCVRAYVTSALFTFQDGHFVTVGHEEMKNSTELVNNESLGYLTTPFGNPCIHGKYFTNAPRVLGAMMASGGAQGIGNAISQWQMTYFAGPNGVVGAPTGSFLPFAAGGALAEGSSKAADWLEKRIQGSFDMVFVPASIPIRMGKTCRYRPNQVSFHLTQTINIDKQKDGRVLDYGRRQNYTRDFSLR